MKKGKDAYYFSHDVNARRDPKLMALIQDYGIEGYGRYFIIIELLAEAREYKYEKENWAFKALAQELKSSPDDAKKFVELCISEYGLFKEDDKFFWSDSLLRRMQIKEEKRRKKSEAGKKGAKVLWEKKRKEDGNN